jgi:D-hydroxyproline dehydrogenase subunit beta
MNTTADAIIIGGGIVGAACAYYLSERGLAVHLIERDFPASGTSRACDGLILQWDKLPGAELSLGLASQKLWRDLAAELDAEIGFEQAGTIFLAEQADQMEAGKEKANALSASGQRAEVLTPGELRELEPELALDLAGGVLFPDDLQVDPRRATLAMLAAARRRGARITTGEAVLNFQRAPGDNPAITGVITPGGSIAAAHVICAAGVWSAEITQLAGLSLPIRPRKGHILVSDIRPKKIHHPLLEGGYATTVQLAAEDVQVALVAEMTASGSLLLGSSREFAGFDRRVSLAVIRAIAQRAARFLPHLAHSSVIRSYAGLRPWSPDHLPLIGPCEQAPGFYLASGHEGAGIGLAPITGKLIADWVTGAALPPYANAVLPDRFDPIKGSKTNVLI